MAARQSLAALPPLVLSREDRLSAILDQVITGEYLMGLPIFNHHAVLSKQKGAPVDWVRFEPAMVVLAVFQLTAKGSSPNAARLLLDFFTSEEGQKLFREADYMPVDAAVPPRELPEVPVRE